MSDETNAVLEPHGWVLNMTCRNCGITGDHEESFPCCEHVAPLRMVVRRLARTLVLLAPYPPEVSEGVIAELETAREMLGDSVEDWRKAFEVPK